MVAKHYCLLSAACVLLGLHTPLSAEDSYPADWVPKAEQLTPISNWGLDYGESKCRLARLFGSDDDQHLLFIEQNWPSNGFSLTAAGSSFKRFRRGTTAFVGLQDDVPLRRVELPPTGELNGFGPTIILSLGVTSQADDASQRLRVGADADDASQGGLGTAGLDTAEGSKINRVIFRRRGGKAVSFETGNLEEAFKALNACTADLLKDWGLDPSKHQSFTRADWLNEEQITKAIVDIYPEEALRKGEQAIFRMRVIVEEDGRVSDCKIDAATTVDRLASPACNEMQAARFSPARDEKGKPMRSFYATSVSYRINE